MIINLWSPKHGQGLTTTGLAMAASLEGTVQYITEGDNLPDALAIAGLPSGTDAHDHWEVKENLTISIGGFGTPDHVIYDCETNWELRHQGADLNLMVVQADYLALRRLMITGKAAELDGFIVVLDSSRALNVDDIKNVTGLKHFATVPVDPAVARAVDAGLLMHRRMRQFNDLKLSSFVEMT